MNLPRGKVNARPAPLPFFLCELFIEPKILLMTFIRGAEAELAVTAVKQPPGIPTIV